MNPTKKKTQTGFGVIESIILFFIIGLLGVLTIMAYLSAQGAKRDAQRVSDVQQLQKALKFYYEEFGQYPQHSNNIAVGIDNSFSRFVSPWPTAPQPADGCGIYNAYAYMQLDNGADYQIRFCLGKGYNNLKSGVHIASPDGVQ